MATETRNGQRLWTAKDIELYLQEQVEINTASGRTELNYDVLEMLIQVKQARALEFIMNTLRDGKLKVVQG